jgi:hypothetical protein
MCVCIHVCVRAYAGGQTEEPSKCVAQRFDQGIVMCVCVCVYLCVCIHACVEGHAGGQTEEPCKCVAQRLDQGIVMRCVSVCVCVCLPGKACLRTA